MKFIAYLSAIACFLTAWSSMATGGQTLPLLKITDIPGSNGFRRAVVVGSVVEMNATTLPALFAKDARIRELLIEAEFLTVSGAVRVPGGNTVVICRRLTFPNETGSFSIRPEPVAQNPATTDSPLNGLSAGTLAVFCDEFKQVGEVLRFDLKGGAGQDARPGQDGTPGNDATPGGPPGVGGNGGEFVCSEALHQEIQRSPNLLDVSGGPNGARDRTRSGGAAVSGHRERRRISLPFGGWTYGFGSREVGGRPPGRDAAAPEARGVSQAGAQKSFDHLPPADEILAEIVEFLEGVSKQERRAGKALSRSFYNRTADWLVGADGKRSERNLSPARKVFRDRLEALMK